MPDFVMGKEERIRELIARGKELVDEREFNPLGRRAVTVRVRSRAA
jgi:hypothetical protein